MFTSLSAAVQYVQSNRLKPLYLLTEDAKTDFAEQPCPADPTNREQTNAANELHADELHGDENAVVVGLAPDKFIYETMNKAFR